MNHRIILIQFLFACFTLAAHAQHLEKQTVSTAGTYFSNESIKLDWNLGEAVIFDGKFDEGALSQGFHTGFQIIITGINEEEKRIIQFFPNPSSGEISITNQLNISALKIKIYAANGTEMKFNRTHEGNQKINLDLSDFSSGQYLIKFFDEENTFLKSDRIMIIK